jgi:hypothetical protein
VIKPAFNYYKNSRILRGLMLILCLLAPPQLFAGYSDVTPQQNSNTQGSLD